MDAQIVAPIAQAAARSRLWEIDTVRGLAVVAMIFFHFMWDLQFFGLTSVNVFSSGWQTFARSIGSTFIFVMGLSLTLDAARTRGDDRGLWRRNLRRGAVIFGCGLLVSLATFAVVGNEFVRFGILHLAGASIIFATPFVRARAWVSALVGLLVIGVGAFLQTRAVSFPWLIPFGIRQAGVTMVDYYPLLPWFGVALLGIAFGQTAYSQGVRHFMLPELNGALVVRGLRLLGRHSLVIYLVHQPVLIALLLAARFARLVQKP